MRITTFCVTLGLLLVTALPAAADFRTRISQQLAAETTLSDVEAEISFGRDVAARILGNYPQMRNERLTRYVNLVGKGVAEYAGRPELNFHFAVLNTSSVNAFAAPGGYVFITKGALKLMQDESELAAVLAHEIAHISEKHIVKELNIRAEDEEGKSITSLVGGSSDPIRIALQQMVDKAIEILFKRGYLQEDEYAADLAGNGYIAMTSYDPTALQRYITRMQAQAGAKTAERDKTHPPADERINRLGVFLENNQLSSTLLSFTKERFKRYVDIR
ncbi:MAG: peptidase M48 Ste24p [Desulfuromonas sp.]|nr:MAG: peptidase M48 Ste24p [Desulfuromonas sp.]